MVFRHVPLFQSFPPLPPVGRPPRLLFVPLFFRVTFRATQTESKPVWGRVELTSLKAPTPPSLPILPTINMKKSIKVFNGVLRKEIQSAVTAGCRPSFRQVCVCAFADERHAALCARARSIFAKKTFLCVAFEKPAMSEAAHSSHGL